MNNLTGWQPRPCPARVTLEGRFCRLEPLDPVRHGDQLFAASMAPGAEERFCYLLDSPQDRTGFEGWLARASVSEDPMVYGVIDLASGRCGGARA